MRYLLAVAIVLGLFVPAWAKGAESGITRVAVGAFVEQGALVRPGWLSERVQQKLIDDLSRHSHVHAFALDVPPVRLSEVQRAMSQARSDGAHYLVVGICHVTPGEVRINGEVFSTTRERSVGVFHVVGSPQELFAIEESLVHEVRRIVDEVVPVPDRTIATAPPAPPAVPAPVPTYVPSAYHGSALERSMYYPGSLLELGYETTPVYRREPYFHHGIHVRVPGFFFFPRTIVIIKKPPKHDPPKEITPPPISTPAPTTPTVPSEVRTRLHTGSLVARPPEMTVQRPPSHAARRPSTVATQPSMVARQPSMVARQPSVVARQPSMIATQPPMVATQPPTVARPSSIVGQQPRSIIPSPQPSIIPPPQPSIIPQSGVDGGASRSHSSRR